MAPTLADRSWAVVSVASGLIALNGALLAVAALFDGTPIPVAVGVGAAVLGALGSRATWRRTIWAARTRATGLRYWDQQRARDLRPHEVLLQRVLMIGTPIVAVVAAAATDLPSTTAVPLLAVVPLLIATMPQHQRKQLLGRD